MDGGFMKRNIKSFVIAIFLPLLVGGLSALISSGGMDFYKTIIRPPLSPPSVLFPIVWSILFILMGISSAIIYNTKSVSPPKKRLAFYTYALSLFFNFFWSIFFFNFNLFLFSFFWLLILLFLILRTIMKYYKINPIAAYLQIPYLVWVTFAAYLNLAIWWLNR